MKNLSFAFAMLLVGACSTPRKAPTPGGGNGTSPEAEPAANAAERNDCTADEDCALVEACCGCNAGGRKVGIRVDQVAAYDASRETRCAGNMCAQAISDHPSCNAEPVCRKGHCVAQPHMNRAPEAPLPPAAPIKPD